MLCLFMNIFYLYTTPLSMIELREKISERKSERIDINDKKENLLELEQGILFQ